VCWAPGAAGCPAPAAAQAAGHTIWQGGAICVVPQRAMRVPVTAVRSCAPLLPACTHWLVALLCSSPITMRLCCCCHCCCCCCLDALTQRNVGQQRAAPCRLRWRRRQPPLLVHARCRTGAALPRLPACAAVRITMRKQVSYRQAVCASQVRWRQP
jgi:hypothetical protein